MTFEVIVLGVGDAFTERYFPSALLLHCDDTFLAVDCPDLYRRVLREAGERAGRSLSASLVDRCLITHLHGDHVNGLEMFAFYKHFVDQRSLELITSEPVRRELWPGRLAPSMGVLWDGTDYRSLAFDDYFQHRCLEPGTPLQVGPFHIEARFTKHHIPTCALRVRAADRSFGYSCDTAFDPELVEWLSGADLIVHETNLGPAHTDYASLATLPADLRRRMRLIHYPDDFDREERAIALCREGDVYSV